MAYLALQLGDKDKLFAYANEAVNSDPKFANARWLLAEAYLARGENRQAAREAKTANLINTDFPAAQSAYERSGGIALVPTEVDKFLARSRKFIAEGKPDLARRLLQRIMPRLDTPCPDCHKELAALNEQSNRYQKAIHEWQAYLREAPDRAAAEQIPSRIEQLKRKLNPQP
jgi:tetratricopeptide (TPR) repeat protein